jgi:hypothetical protein
MVKSTALTVDGERADSPAGRRADIEKARTLGRRHLPKGDEEGGACGDAGVSRCARPLSRAEKTIAIYEKSRARS